jgi:hypothetical protein
MTAKYPVQVELVCERCEDEFPYTRRRKYLPRYCPVCRYSHVGRKINQVSCRTGSGNTSGFVGVHKWVTGRGDTQYLVWCAEWYENKRKRSRSFSVSCYGYEQAKTMAVVHRCRMVDGRLVPGGRTHLESRLETP